MESAELKAGYLILTSAYLRMYEDDACEIIREARERIIREMGTAAFLDVSNLAHLLIYSRY